MTRCIVDFHRRAVAELKAVVSYYRRQGAAVSESFSAEVERAIGLVAEAPERWPPYLEETRRFLLRRFPFSVVYVVRGTTIYVLAVAHAKRRPGYWTRRRDTPRDGPLG